MAGYKGNRVTLASVGYENLRKPHIAAEIERRLEESAMSANEVLYRLAEHARASMADFLVGNNISISRARERGKLHLIKEFTTVTTSKGDDVISERVTFKLHDAQTALIQIGRAHSLFTDRVESNTTTNGVTIYMPDNGRGDVYNRN